MFEALARHGFQLDGKVAIVTGGGSGIGRATAMLFSSVGAKTVVADLNLEAARETVEQCANCPVAIQADISDEASVDELFAKAESEFGSCTILVNNAACRTKAGFMDMTVAEWDEMHAVNALGTFLCMRAAIRQMRRAATGGAIVNVSSVSAAHPTIFRNAHYDSSKAGVDALTRAAAVEFAPSGIRINSVQPGGTDTSGGRTISQEVQPSGPMMLPGRMALGRMAQPEELASAILFLASDAASYITGQHLAVDGGYSVS